MDCSQNRASQASALLQRSPNQQSSGLKHKGRMSGVAGDVYTNLVFQATEYGTESRTRLNTRGKSLPFRWRIGPLKKRIRQG